MLGNVFAHAGRDRVRRRGCFRAAQRRGAARHLPDHGPGRLPGRRSDLARGQRRRLTTGLDLDIARRTADAGGGRLTRTARQRRPAGRAELPPPPTDHGPPAPPRVKHGHRGP
ncbi:hypothetical protein HBB16_18265 [Pseudonocardia sp. MCCB 268]|nr:hypothetical protein [Pseudonocardia cytotoxica]